MYEYEPFSNTQYIPRANPHQGQLAPVGYYPKQPVVTVQPPAPAYYPDPSMSQYVNTVGLPSVPGLAYAPEGYGPDVPISDQARAQFAQYLPQDGYELPDGSWDYGTSAYHPPKPSGGHRMANGRPSPAPPYVPVVPRHGGGSTGAPVVNNGSGKGAPIAKAPAAKQPPAKTAATSGAVSNAGTWQGGSAYSADPLNNFRKLGSHARIVGPPTQDRRADGRLSPAPNTVLVSDQAHPSVGDMFRPVGQALAPAAQAFAAPFMAAGAPIVQGLKTAAASRAAMENPRVPASSIPEPYDAGGRALQHRRDAMTEAQAARLMQATQNATMQAYVPPSVAHHGGAYNEAAVANSDLPWIIQQGGNLPMIPGVEHVPSAVGALRGRFSPSAVGSIGGGRIRSLSTSSEAIPPKPFTVAPIPYHPAGSEPGGSPVRTPAYRDLRARQALRRFDAAEARIRNANAASAMERMDQHDAQDASGATWLSNLPRVQTSQYRPSSPSGQKVWSAWDVDSIPRVRTNLPEGMTVAEPAPPKQLTLFEGGGSNTEPPKGWPVSRRRGRSAESQAFSEPPKTNTSGVKSKTPKAKTK